MKIKTKRGARRIRNQRVITRRFVTTDYTGCPYITAGKLYKVNRYGTSGEKITFDAGDEREIISPSWSSTCGFLDGHDWQWGVI